MKKVQSLTHTLVLCMLVVSFMSCDNQNPEPPVNNDPPDQLISITQAKQMFDSYTERRVRVIKDFEQTVDSTQEFAPTRYGEYDYDTIKQYLAYIESEADLAGVEIGGLRFYFLNYPNASQFPDGGGIQYPRQNTFALLPTTEVNGTQQGFITRTTSDGGREMILISDWLAENQVQQQTGSLNKFSTGNPRMLMMNPFFGSMQEEGDDNSTILNESNLVPPPPQGDSDFD